MHARASTVSPPASPRGAVSGALDVSVIVVNWNTIAHLRRCLASIARETDDVALEVIVVDNASPHG